MTERVKLKDFRGGLFAGGQKGPLPVQPKEQTISKSIQDFLDKKGIYNDRLNSGKVQVIKQFRQKDGNLKRFETWLQLAKKGTPDRFFIVAGKIYFCEVKQKGKKPTPEQLERHQELRKSGAVVIVADSIDAFIRQYNEIFHPSDLPY
jgi:hypothetical protein